MSEVIALEAALPSVNADFRDTLRTLSPPTSVRLIVLDDVPDVEVRGLLPDGAEWRSERDQDLLLLVGDNTLALDAVLSDLGPLAVEVASALQDHVMDSLNTPWPIVRTRDGRPVVVEPALIQGIPFWSADGASFVEFGELMHAV